MLPLLALKAGNKRTNEINFFLVCKDKEREKENGKYNTKTTNNNTRQ